MSIGIRSQTVLLLLAVGLATSLAHRASANPSPFYMGGDISLESVMQGQYAPDPPFPPVPRAHFFDNGVEKPMDRIMYDHGANLFRLRIFVNPATDYIYNGANPNYGAIQSQAYDIALAQQIKANCPNAKIMLDFHYSDTWADPGKQFIPAAWATPTQTLAQLETTVQNYTQTTLAAFKTAGVMPDIVQLGNETTGGLLWPTGELSSGTTAQKTQAGRPMGGF
jgi:arabinogalactan endo-1,4-beta-galactosidase